MTLATVREACVRARLGVSRQGYLAMLTSVMRPRCAPLILVAGLFFATFAAQAREPADLKAESTYRLPTPALRSIVDAPQAPRLSLSPKRDLIAYMQVPSLPGIDVVAQPELKLAGLRIHPRTHSASAFSFSTDLWLQAVDGGAERRIEGLPQ